MLQIQNLKTYFEIGSNKRIKAVDGVNLEIQEGDILGLVGESGCGKTVLSLSILGLIAPPGKIISGSILWKGRDLLTLNHKDMLKIRGRDIAMVFQNPLASLNPVYTIGSQLTSVINLHKRISKYETKKEAMQLLNMVKIPDPARTFNSYPHQLSGGMCQRVMIAIALSCHPKLLIADEPTASLDVTIQAQIMDLLLDLRDRFGMGILFVSHDLGVIARMCDNVAVMYLGKIIEYSSAKELYTSPMHPYTQALLKSIPVPDPRQRGKISRIEGDIPGPENIPSGCPFRTRCPMVFEQCANMETLLNAVNNKHLVACLLYK